MAQRPIGQGASDDRSRGVVVVRRRIEQDPGRDDTEERRLVAVQPDEDGGDDRAEEGLGAADPSPASARR